MIQLSRRQITLIAIALITLVILTIAIAPNSGSLQQRGSTYNRAPEGYGAWYAFMEERKIPIKRWQKTAYPNSTDSTDDDPLLSEKGKPAPTKNPITLLRISPQIAFEYPDERWVKAGNVLVLVGMKAPATSAPFTANLDSPSGKIGIDTSRRHIPPKNPSPESPKFTGLVNDSFGSVVWEEKLGNGRIIYASTPYLAANAYQDFRPNYELLAKLVTQPGHPIWVDEYLHGYKDPVPKTDKAASEENLFSYLLKTPLSLLAMQVVVILGVLIWGQNRRLGPPEPIITPTLDNSEAYIQAMAGVLNKANCSEFVLETVGKAEQLELQKALGLGTVPLSLAELSAAWTIQTGQPDTALKTVLQTAVRHPRISEADLRKWINEMQKIKDEIGRMKGRVHAQNL